MCVFSTWPSHLASFSPFLPYCVTMWIFLLLFPDFSYLYFRARLCSRHLFLPSFLYFSTFLCALNRTEPVQLELTHCFVFVCSFFYIFYCIFFLFTQSWFLRNANNALYSVKMQTGVLFCAATDDGSRRPHTHAGVLIVNPFKEALWPCWLGAPTHKAAACRSGA